MIGKYAPDSVIGMIGGGGGGGAVAGAPAAGGGGGGGITLEEVSKHNSKSDCWVAWLRHEEPEHVLSSLCLQFGYGSK